MIKYYLAIDIGASSGRHIIGYKDARNVFHEDEVYRFKNGIVTNGEEKYWDIDRIVREVKHGIRLALIKYPTISSLAIDTWGVDYVLMANKQRIDPVHAYRSARTLPVISEVHDLISFRSLYEITGSQLQSFNSIYQLYVDKKAGRLENATDFLMIPEYITYILTGKKVKEYTNASTTGLMDVKTNTFSQKIINTLGLPEKLFQDLARPGHIVGNLTKAVQKEVGGNIKVVLCASHDTASAVEGIDNLGAHPYLSSGTWSLLGVKIAKGITNEKAETANFTNEYGPNYIRFQKNIMGLWILQQLSIELNIPFPKMRKLAKESTYSEIFDVNDQRFLSPPKMSVAISEYFKEHKRPLPQSNGDLSRTIHYSLAHSYKDALNELAAITHKTYKTLYVVGGGAHNDYLNKLCAEVANINVVALPIEATAYGNLKIQMEADEHA